MKTIIQSSSNEEIRQYREARQKLLALNARIKSLISHPADLTDFDKPGHSETGVAFIDGKPVERVIIILRGSGCQWANREKGGCTMCGHLSGSANGRSVPAEQLKRQFDTAMARYDFRRYPMLCLYNGGSFLNEQEIPPHVRRYMLGTIAANPHIKRLIIESRVDYISRENLEEIEALLPDTDVEIGVGVETASDTIRDLVLNKGVTSRDLIKMGRLFQQRRVKLLAYVLVNPPFLTEAEAIADTAAAIRFSQQIGADIVSLEAVSIQHLTLVSFLAEAGVYHTPWLWSIFEIVKQTYHLGIDIRIGGFEFFPIPKEFTSNCSGCNQEMIDKVQAFNLTNDLEVLQNLSCPDRCDLHWQGELKKTDPRNLPQRIISTLDSIDIPAILERFDHGGPSRRPFT
jgi:archaeosine synthase beta-subunit